MVHYSNYEHYIGTYKPLWVGYYGGSRDNYLDGVNGRKIRKFGIDSKEIDDGWVIGMMREKV